MSKISVFGGTGFIGSAFYKKYSGSIVIDRDEIKPATNDILYLISTVDNYNVLTNPHIDIETNLVHLMKVLENCKDTDTTFTFISSWFVYGKTELPANENSICSPKGFYSITKYAAEQLVESYCKTFNIKYKIIRLGNVVGKSDSKVSKKKNALQFLLNEIKLNNKINLYNEGQFYRDYIDVEDVVEGIKFIMDNGENNEIYNLASGVPILFKDIIEYAYTQLNSTSEIGVMEPTDFHKLVQVESMYLDTTKLNNLGFKPSKNIYQIINNLIK
jgi:nucleoside-diphosphate-sugar epimerase